MLKCPSCGHQNRMGMLFCEECGAGITSARANATIATRQMNIDDDTIKMRATWGSARFGTGTSILLHIRGAVEPVTLEPTHRMIFGRSDLTSDEVPDVDLAPYGALEMGVSRHHAIMELLEDTLMLTDAGSSNGTYLNGQRLMPNQPRVVRDGDEIRLGKLIAHVYFK